MAHTPARPTAASGRSARRVATRSSHAAPKRRRPWNANGRSEAEPPFSIQAEIVDGVAVGQLALPPRYEEERIRACGAGDHVRLLPAPGFEKGAVVRPAKARPRELVALGVLPSRADEPAPFESRQPLRHPLPRPDRRLDENLEADERPTRHPGQHQHETPPS